jgi:ethanolaminephosphotransferase
LQLSYIALRSHCISSFKAITTGTIPGFIDVILNVDSKELSEDNLVTQMKNSNKKIIFYGDDTWIKLFPNHFMRHDGTTSFFVTDYIEVKYISLIFIRHLLHSD